MSKIAFVTDTTCNLPEELAQDLDVTIVPVYVIFGDESYKDYVEMSPADFYSRLAEYRAADLGMPTTSQPTPEDFRVAYTGLAEQGYTDAISIHVTAKSSGTCQSAELAKAMVEGFNIHVVDSASTSMHMGFMLMEAIQAVKDGGGVEAALAAIEQVKANSCLVFGVTDLAHLASSGRTEGHEKATESALAVKPFVSVVDGVPKALGTERTSSALLKKVLEYAQDQKGAAPIKRLAVVYGNIPAEAERWAGEAAEALGYTGDPYLVDFGPALAVHFGPGLLGVAAQWG